MERIRIRIYIHKEDLQKGSNADTKQTCGRGGAVRREGACDE